MMNEILLDALNKQHNCNDDYKIALDATEKILYYSDVARKEGLLVLDEEVCKIVKDKDPDLYGYQMQFSKKITKLERLIVSIFMLIVDGTDPEKVIEIAAGRYYMSDFTGAEAIAAYIIISGALMIQEGENPRIIEETLISLLPEDMQYEYADNKRNANIEEFDNEPETPIPESFFEDVQDFIKKGSLAEVTCRTILSCDNRCIQHVLRKVDASTLATAILGMDGKTRRTVFDNMSSQYGRGIYTEVLSKDYCMRIGKQIWDDDIYDSERRSSAKQLQIENAMMKILNVFDDLEMKYEIVLNTSELDRVERKRAQVIYEYDILRYNEAIDERISKLNKKIAALNGEKIKIDISASSFSDNMCGLF